jgi:hypothetical protein
MLFLGLEGGVLLAVVVREGCLVDDWMFMNASATVWQTIIDDNLAVDDACKSIWILARTCILLEDWRNSGFEDT